MSTSSLARGFAAIALAAALFAGAVQVQAAREREYPAPPVDEDAVYITSGSALRRLSGAYNALAADVYWIRAIQYYGATKRRLADQPLAPEPPPMLAAVESTDYSQLYALLDITTTLDPRFDIAYRFGSVFLAESYPAGAGRVDLAVKLLEKGFSARPDKWEYMEDMGFVYYWYAHDYRQAAAAFERAAEVPGAPVWLKPLAAATLAQGGDRRSSRAMWERILQSADIDWLRKSAEHHLLQFRALDEIDALQSRLDAFAKVRGGPPGDWVTVLRAQVFPRIPADPAGTPYELTSDGRVRLSRSSELFPLAVEPEALPQSTTSR
jgi:tetratricopeptide (TPR) repeat protein